MSRTKATLHLGSSKYDNLMDLLVWYIGSDGVVQLQTGNQQENIENSMDIFKSHKKKAYKERIAQLEAKNEADQCIIQQLKAELEEERARVLRLVKELSRKSIDANVEQKVNENSFRGLSMSNGLDGYSKVESPRFQCGAVMRLLWC